MKVLLMLVVVAAGVLWLVARQLRAGRPASDPGWSHVSLAGRRGSRIVLTVALVALCLYLLARLGVPGVYLTGQVALALGRAIGGLIETLGHVHRL